MSTYVKLHLVKKKTTLLTSMPILLSLLQETGTVWNIVLYMASCYFRSGFIGKALLKLHFKSFLNFGIASEVLHRYNIWHYKCSITQSILSPGTYLTEMHAFNKLKVLTLAAGPKSSPSTLKAGDRNWLSRSGWIWTVLLAPRIPCRLYYTGSLW